jgi:hypothetical protein
MKLTLRFVLILTALIAAAFLVLAVACGGDEEEEGPAAGETPAAAETPAAGETPAAAETPTGEEGELPAIPTYPGAEEIETATWTGAGAFPIPMMGGEGPAPEEYGTVQFTVYETSDSPEKVIDFYKEEFKGWKEEWTFSMEQFGEKGGVVVWSRDDGNIAAWLGAVEEEGTTSVIVATGVLQ